MRLLLCLIAVSTLSFLPACSCAASSRLSARIADEDLNLQRTHVAWPSPEKMLKDITSTDDATRLRAMLLFGLDDQQARILYNPSPTERQVIRPDIVRLNYAVLGTEPDRQALLAFQAGQYVYVTVALATKAGWVRIAYCNMWSKYDGENGDALSEDVGLSTAPGDITIPPIAFELVLRVSGGGTGIYNQQEAHYRVYKGELRNVFSFKSAERSCPTSSNGVFTCDIEKSWFTRTSLTSGGEVVHLLVKKRGTFLTEKQPSILYSIRELEGQYLRPYRCTSYVSDALNFDYKLGSNSPEPCRSPPRK